MPQQRILVIREPNFEDYGLLQNDRAYRILNPLRNQFDISNVFNMPQTLEYLKAQSPDLVVLSLEKFLAVKAPSFQKLRQLMRQIPLLILSHELLREDRIQIHKILNTFAFQLNEEETDLQKYLQSFRFQNAKPRNFLRYKRSRELKLYFNNQEISAKFVDYSQTGAQIEYAGERIPNKSQVLIQYHSQSDHKLRAIDSYVVWTAQSFRAGIQFLAVR